MKRLCFISVKKSALVMAYDVGMQRMLSQKKDFIGNKMAQRP